MLATINVRYVTIGTYQKISEIIFRYINHKISAITNRYQLSYLEMFGVYPIAGICQELKCIIARYRN